MKYKGSPENFVAISDIIVMKLGIQVPVVWPFQLPRLYQRARHNKIHTMSKLYDAKKRTWVSRSIILSEEIRGSMPTVQCFAMALVSSD